MKKILVPNDFSVKPLIILKKIMEVYPEEEFDITLLHGVYPSSSVTDLLFYSPKRIMNELETQEYIQACHLFKNKFYSRIAGMRADIIATSSRSSVNNFLEKAEIQEIYLPDGLKMKFRGKNSFNIVSTLKKAKVHPTFIHFEEEVSSEIEKNTDLSSLFLSGSYKSYIYENSLVVS